MKGIAYTRTDLLHLTRWVTLFFLILLVAAPYLRHQERNAQTMGFGNGVALADESRAEGDPGAQLPVRGADRHGDFGRASIEASIEWQLGKTLVSGVSDPLVPIEDGRGLVFQGLALKPTELHVASPSSGEQPAGESKSIGKSTEKEKPAHPYDGIIRKAAERYEVDPALVKAIIMAESSYNPRAVSRKGARGLMQLMPRTARALGVEDSFDPEDNIDAGVRYFKQLLEQFDGDLKLAIAAYNAGSRKVRMYKGVPPFKYTRYYVAKVIEYHQRYQQ